MQRIFIVMLGTVLLLGCTSLPTVMSGDSAGREVALISGSCARMSSGSHYFDCKGVVRNVGTETLEYTFVVITWVDASGTPISTDESGIDYWKQLFPNQESGWEIMPNFNPALQHYRISFRQMSGDPIKTRDDRKP